MTFILRMLYSPPVLVALLTFWPFLIPQFDSLNDLTKGLSRSVGVDPWLYAYAVTCVLAYALGHVLFAAGGRPPSQAISAQILASGGKARCRRVTAMAIVGLLAVGLAVLFYTVSQSYMETVIRAATAQETNTDIRESAEGFIASKKMPGVIRMFGFSVVGALVLAYAVALSSPPWSRGWRTLGMLLTLSVVAMLSRSLIVLDRYAPAAAALLGLFVLIHRIKFGPKAILVSLAGTVGLFISAAVLFSVASSIRLREAEGRNQILEYADLGIANASLAYQTTTQFTWGTATLMGPVLMVPRGLGIDYQFPTYDSQWVWNPASNLLCTSLREFGVFGFIIYLIYGSVIGRVVRNRRIKPKSIFWGVAHLWGLYVIISIWTQPVVASPDVWTAVFLTLIAGGCLDRLARAGAHERGRNPVANEMEVPL